MKPKIMTLERENFVRNVKSSKMQTIKIKVNIYEKYNFNDSVTGSPATFIGLFRSHQKQKCTGILAPYFKNLTKFSLFLEKVGF